MLDALADVDRRKLLVTLLDHNREDDSQTIPADSDSEAVAIEQLVWMEYAHLRNLEEYGFVKRDRQNNEVVKGPNFDEIRPLLELLADHGGDLPDDWL